MVNNTTGFEKYYKPITVEMPLGLLVSSVCYITILLLGIVWLITQPNPRYSKKHLDIFQSNNNESNNTNIKDESKTTNEETTGGVLQDDVDKNDDLRDEEMVIKSNPPPLLQQNDSLKKKKRKNTPNHSAGDITVEPHPLQQQQQQHMLPIDSAKLYQVSRIPPTTSFAAPAARGHELELPNLEKMSSVTSPTAPSSLHHDIHSNQSNTDDEKIRHFSWTGLEPQMVSNRHVSRKDHPSAAASAAAASAESNSPSSLFNDEAPVAALEEAQPQQPKNLMTEPMQQQMSFPRPLRSWDLMSSTAMRFRHGHFSGKSVQRLVQQERAQQLENNSISGGAGGEGSSSRGESWNSKQSGYISKSRSGTGMSHVANQVLDMQTVQGEAEYYRHLYMQQTAVLQQQIQRQRQRYPQRSQPNLGTAFTPGMNTTPGIGGNASVSNHMARRLLLSLGARSNRAPSVVSHTSSGRSRLPALSPDVVSPEDAADAFDLGLALPEDTNNQQQSPPNQKKNFGAHLLDLVEPNSEMMRIANLATPATLGAIADPCFRLGLVVILSRLLDVDSMVAFLLVVLFVRITTEELSGAITDAQSSLLNQALSIGGDAGFHLAGKQIQFAISILLATVIPLLLAWVFVMNPLVLWLIPENHRIAELAGNYTRIIVIDYALQSTSRVFMLVFHMTGQAGFELHVDLVAAALTIAASALTAGLAKNASLTWIALIQVLIGALKVATKIAIVKYKGLLEPYRQGLWSSCSRSDRPALWAFVGTFLPLLLGSLVELREWEILVLFIRHLGGAEVATWALMGVIWEIFEASTEGLGEAAAIRVSFLLSENCPDLAQRLAHKSVLLGMIASLVVTSVFLMIGPNLSVALTRDAAIQGMFNGLVGTTGLANVAMSLSQVYWSLLGSQGRFGVGSSSILLCRWLIAMPLASVFIFKFHYELSAVASALAIGYMTASAILAWRLFDSDWKLYAKIAQQNISGEEDVGLLESDEEEDDQEDDDGQDFDNDSSSSSTGFFG